MAAEQQARGFAPLVDAKVRVLVLGSLPGRASLAAGHYYAHPQNQFWRLMGAVLGQDLAALPYPERVAHLLRARVGLWDSIGTAHRMGSLDSAIRQARATDLPGLVTRLPQLEVIAFNGQKAAQIGLRTLAGLSRPPRFIALPSSSPAHTRPFGQKADIWRAALGPIVGADSSNI